MPPTILDEDREREAARERVAALALGHLRAVLSGAQAPHNLDYANPAAEEVVVLLNDLWATKDAFERKTADAIESITRALPFVRGEDVSFNGVGILQMTGIAVDQLAMLFVKQREYSLKALGRYHRHEEVALAIATAGDAAAVAEMTASEEREQQAKDELIAKLLDWVAGEFGGPESIEHWSVDADLAEEGLEVRVIFTNGDVRTYKTTFDGEIVELNSTEGGASS